MDIEELLQKYLKWVLIGIFTIILFIVVKNAIISITNVIKPECKLENIQIGQNVTYRNEAWIITDKDYFKYVGKLYITAQKITDEE